MRRIVMTVGAVFAISACDGDPASPTPVRDCGVDAATVSEILGSTYIDESEEYGGAFSEGVLSGYICQFNPSAAESVLALQVIKMTGTGAYDMIVSIEESEGTAYAGVGKRAMLFVEPAIVVLIAEGNNGTVVRVDYTTGGGDPRTEELAEIAKAALAG